MDEDPLLAGAAAPSLISSSTNGAHTSHSLSGWQTDGYPVPAGPKCRPVVVAGVALVVAVVGVLIGVGVWYEGRHMAPINALATHKLVYASVARPAWWQVAMRDAYITGALCQLRLGLFCAGWVAILHCLCVHACVRVRVCAGAVHRTDAGPVRQCLTRPSRAARARRPGRCVVKPPWAEHVAVGVWRHDTRLPRLWLGAQQWCVRRWHTGSALRATNAPRCCRRRGATQAW